MDLRNRKESRRKKEEEEVIGQIKDNPKAFYSYTKRKSVIRTKIGSLIVNGLTIS